MAHHHAHRPFREKLKDVFALNSSERRGTTLLMAICLLAAGWVVYEQWIRPAPAEDLAQLEQAWVPMAASIAEEGGRDQRSEGQVDPAPRILFHFDPNGLPLEQWLELGLTERQAQAIHRFEAKGGRFRSKKDLARMYVVKPELFDQWEPYIDLPDSLVRAQRPARGQAPGTERPHTWKERAPAPAYTPKPERRVAQVEVNAADSTALEALPGIGPSFARGILRYRDKLGGFHDLGQLAEVYVLRDKPDAVERLRNLLTVDPSRLRRINVNTVEAETLGPHPYAGWKVAKALVAYRKRHGAFKEVGDIRQCVLVTDSIYTRLAPYLTVE